MRLVYEVLSKLLNTFVGIPLQMTTDKGSEIWEMIHMHRRLRYPCERFTRSNIILIVMVLTGLKPPPNSLSNNGQLLFRCRVNVTRQLRVFGGGNAKAKAIAFVNLLPLGRRRASSTPITSFMCTHFQHDAIPFKL